MTGTEVEGQRCLAGRGLSQFHRTITCTKRKQVGQSHHIYLCLHYYLCAPNENYAKIINAIVMVLMFDSPWQTPQYIYRVYAINIKQGTVSIQSPIYANSLNYMKHQQFPCSTEDILRTATPSALRDNEHCTI